MSPEEVIEYLSNRSIPFVRVGHAPALTCEELSRMELPGLLAKNLFVRDQKGKRHLLIIIPCDQTVNLQRLGEVTGAGRLSFASSDRLMRKLGVLPGSVTPFGLLSPEAGDVEVFVDREVVEAKQVCFHPMVNTVSLVISGEGLVKFMKALGVRYEVIESGKQG